MKIREIVLESQQLDEGPIGSAIGAVGRGVGKAVGSAAKGIGAIAGGAMGIGKAIKKGYQTGKSVVSGDDEPAAAGGSAAPATGTAAPAQATAPAAGTQQPAAAPTTTAQINKQGPAGTAPAAVSGGAQQQALAKTAQAAGGDSDKAAQTLYATVKAQVNQLDKKGKQRILQLLQKSMQQTPAQPAAAAPAVPAAKSTAKPAGTPAAAKPAPASTPAAEPAATPAAGAEQPATAAGKKKPIPKKKVAPSQAEIDADRARVMGPTSDSIIRQGSMIAEHFSLYRR